MYQKIAKLVTGWMKGKVVSAQERSKVLLWE